MRAVKEFCRRVFLMNTNLLGAGQLLPVTTYSIARMTTAGDRASICMRRCVTVFKQGIRCISARCRFSFVLVILVSNVHLLRTFLVLLLWISVTIAVNSISIRVFPTSLRSPVKGSRDTLLSSDRTSAIHGSPAIQGV